MSDGVTGLGGVLRSDGLVFAIFDSDTEYFGRSGQGFMQLWEPAEGM